MHCSNLYHIKEQADLAELIVDQCIKIPGKMFFSNSGAEANDGMIKFARRYGHVRPNTKGENRYEVLTFNQSFHGRTLGSLAATGQDKVQHQFQPLLRGFRHLPYNDLEALKNAIGDRTVAIMLEPIQGEGGIRPLPDACLKGLRDLCDETGALLILDEVQCGIGRTGKLFAHEWAGIAPDIMMVAKGIGGGFPLGALLATEDAAAGMTAGTHGSTYGGNPLGRADGAAVLDIIADEAFLADTRRKSGHLRQKLEALVAEHPDVFECVRGAGLMLGLKCVKPAGDVVAAGVAAGVLTVPAADNTVRLLPALNITEAELDEGCARLSQAAASLAA